MPSGMSSGGLADHSGGPATDLHRFPYCPSTVDAEKEPVASCCTRLSGIEKRFGTRLGRNVGVRVSLPCNATNLCARGGVRGVSDLHRILHTQRLSFGLRGGRQGSLLQSQFSPQRQTLAHQLVAGGLLIGEKVRGQDLRFADDDVDVPAEVELLVLRRRAVLP